LVERETVLLFEDHDPRRRLLSEKFARRRETEDAPTDDREVVGR
jgi:hypothetical protein